MAAQGKKKQSNLKIETNCERTCGEVMSLVAQLDVCAVSRAENIIGMDVMVVLINNTFIWYAVKPLLQKGIFFYESVSWDR